MLYAVMVKGQDARTEVLVEADNPENATQVAVAHRFGTGPVSLRRRGIYLNEQGEDVHEYDVRDRLSATDGYQGFAWTREATILGTARGCAALADLEESS